MNIGMTTELKSLNVSIANLCVPNNNIMVILLPFYTKSHPNYNKVYSPNNTGEVLMRCLSISVPAVTQSEHLPGISAED